MRQTVGVSTLTDVTLGSDRQNLRLADEAYRQLEVLFVTGVLPPGQMVSEPQIASFLNLSRMPVREAIKRFEALGLLVPMHRKGVLVLESSYSDSVYLTELRRPLETLLFSLAAQRADERQRARLNEQKERFLRAGFESNQRLMLDADFEYKQISIAAGQNPFVARAVAPIHILARRFWHIHASYEKHRQDMEAATQHHVEIIDAVVQGDTELVKVKVERFVDFISGMMRRVFAVPVGRAVK